MYEFRKLCSKDIFPMTKIISKIGISDFKKCFEGEEVKKIMANGEKDYSSVGMTIVFDIVALIIEKLPNCEDDLYSFLSSISNLSREDIENLSMGEFMQMIVDVVKKDEFRDFIGVVSKLFK